MKTLFSFMSLGSLIFLGIGAAAATDEKKCFMVTEIEIKHCELLVYGQEPGSDFSEVRQISRDNYGGLYCNRAEVPSPVADENLNTARIAIQDRTLQVCKTSFNPYLSLRRAN